MAEPWPAGLPAALIFDVDGTLAETEELHRRAFNDSFADAGLDWVWSQDDYRGLLRTTGGKERIARFVVSQGEDPARVDIAALHAAKTAHYTDLVAQGAIALRPGIADLITEARRAGLAIALATTTSHPNVEALCRAVWGQLADDLFDVIGSGDMVAAKKPAPDIYTLVLTRMGIAPDRAVAFEDSQNGLRAAKAAGLACCVSPGIYTRDDDFTGADLEVAEFSDLGGLGGLHAIWTGAT